jgi:hypothetical protein
VKIIPKKNSVLNKKKLVLKYFFLLKVDSMTEIPNNKIPIDLIFLGNKIRANNNAKKKQTISNLFIDFSDFIDFMF